MMKATVILMAGLMMILTACANSNTGGNGMEPEIETLSRGSMGGFATAERGEEIIRSNDEFRALWQRMHNDIQQEDAGLPEVDFSRNVVVAVMMGEMPSSGYTIRVTGIEQHDDHVKLSVMRTEPGPTCMNLTVITTPHHIVKIPNYEKEIRFDYTTRVEECD